VAGGKRGRRSTSNGGATRKRHRRGIKCPIHGHMPMRVSIGRSSGSGSRSSSGGSGGTILGFAFARFLGRADGREGVFHGRGRDAQVSDDFCRGADGGVVGAGGRGPGGRERNDGGRDIGLEI